MVKLEGLLPPVLPSVVPVVSVFSLEGLSPPVIQSVFPVVSVFLLVGLSPPATETKGTTDGQTGGDKPSNEKTGRREVTDGQTGGDKPPIKIETREITYGPPVLPSVIPLVRLFIGGLITSSFTISSTCCFSLFYGIHKKD
jgi:hypothetical protein